MSCDECVIVGNAPPIPAVKARESILTPALKAKFDVIYDIYQDDESKITAEQAAFVFFCEMFIVYETST